MATPRILSGGQTGVDRAALDVAIELNLPHGGWCPKGRLAEDGPIPAHYQLRETDSDDYAERTELNVRDSDVTLILNIGELSGGTAQTVLLAKRLKKPFLTIQLDVTPAPEAAAIISRWLREQCVKVLNVAGPRASVRQQIYGLAKAVLLEALQPFAHGG